MASKQARTRNHRRQRRKAKEVGSKRFTSPKRTLDALEPLLLEHRDSVYQEFLSLPVVL